MISCIRTLLLRGGGNFCPKDSFAIFSYF
jgi:hypothetical protein